MGIKEIIKSEEELIRRHLLEDVGTDTFEDVVPSERQIRLAHNKAHAETINSLIYAYLSKKCDAFNEALYSEYFAANLACNDYVSLIDIKVDEIPALCENLHIMFLNNSPCINKAGQITMKKSKENLRERGAVYTSNEIAYTITRKTLEQLPVSPKQSRILDFATGTGRFYHQVVNVLCELYNIERDYAILNNVYAVDIDPIAVNICRITAIAKLSRITLENISIVCNHIICRNALITNTLFCDEALSPNDLEGLHLGKFDAVVSNPPYLVLKPNKKKMDESMAMSISLMAKYFRESGGYHYAIEGMLNLYQLSLEAMVKMLKEKGRMGMICPSTLFADMSASKLRKYLLSHHNIFYIKFFSEDEPLFENVTQATCIFHLEKGTGTSIISISNKGKEYSISLDDIKSLFKNNWEIPPVDPIEWTILKKLQGFTKLKDCKQLRNKRGELDLSLNKSYITSKHTKYRLVRGNMITSEGIKDVNHEYVEPEFISTKSDDYKSLDLGKRRLICQQISNQTQRRRLKFVYCSPQDILGNSCNYISSAEGTLSKLFVLLNSALLNWRFKLTSTNNHINNYELDDLPIANLDAITLDCHNDNCREQDIAVCKLYGLNREETIYIINQEYDSI